jgi:hypothetical protein
MWNEENHRFVRSAVPKSFDRAVDRLQNRDSVMFESISLPSLADHANSTDAPPGRSRTPPSRFTDPLFNIGEPTQSNDTHDAASLLDRIQQLEAQNAQKDKEIASLQQQLQKLRHASNLAIHKSSSDDITLYKDQYEALKFQYDKLREALAVNGKLKKVRVKSAQMRKL